MYDLKDLIWQTIDLYGVNQVAVACSFGRASTIVAHIATQIEPKIPVVFCNTLCQPKEIYDYKKNILNEWGLNLVEARPAKGVNFWSLVEKFGLPTTRKSGGKGSNAPKCCYYLKEKPAELIYREMGVKAVITGIMASESWPRRQLQYRYDKYKTTVDGVETCAQRYFAKTQNRWKVHPLMYWNQSDIISYQKENNIPVNEFYTKWDGLYQRSGCLPCTAYTSWQDKLSISHPKLYKKLIDWAKKENSSNAQNIVQQRKVAIQGSLFS